MGWSMKPRMATDLALDALLTAVWRQQERIPRRTYSNREAARSDVLDYTEMFYNPRRRHGASDDLSPVEYERRYPHSLAAV